MQQSELEIYKEIRERNPKRFLRLGNLGQISNSLPPAQVPQRDIIDAQMAFFGTGCIINEQVILQDQEGFKVAA